MWLSTDSSGQSRWSRIAGLWVVLWMVLWELHHVTELAPVSEFSPFFHFIVNLLVVVSLTSWTVCHNADPGTVHRSLMLAFIVCFDAGYIPLSSADPRFESTSLLRSPPIDSEQTVHFAVVLLCC